MVPMKPRESSLEAVMVGGKKDEKAESVWSVQNASFVFKRMSILSI